jgi:PAS domain S-box-containing protein
LIGLLLVRFDPLFGPSIFLKAPNSLDDDLIQDIPSLIELPTKGVFIHIFKEIKTANLFFKQPNKFARGGYESFLITIIMDLNTQISLMFANKLLEGFANYLINLEDAYLAFDYEPQDHKADQEKMKVIKSFFFSYFESIKPVIKTLEIAEQRYQTLFQAARDAIFIINRDSGIIIDVNLEAERLVEKTREEMVSVKALELDLFDEGLVDPTMIKHLVSQPPPIISRIKKSSGKQLYLEVNVNEIKIGDEYYIQYLFHDLSDIYIAEEKLKGHTRKIETLNKIISIANQANDMKDLLKKTIDYFIHLLNLKGCWIYIIDRTKNVANIKSHKGLPEFFFEQNDNLQINQSPYDIVFIQGVALFNENFPELIKKFFAGNGPISGAVIPLFSKLEIIGSINMLLNPNDTLSAEEMELIITIGLEIGTAIEKMQNRESLKLSEAKNAILLDHIPFSIFRISIDGILQDIKLDKKIKMAFEIKMFSQDYIGKNIHEILPDKIAKEALFKIEKAIETQKSEQLRFVIPFKDNQIIFHTDIIPIGKYEVLAFVQNLTRTW